MPRTKHHSIDSYIGARVRMRRLMLNMSQEKLSSRLGVTFQQIQKYEKGTNRISAGRLLELAIALRVPVSFFYDGLDNPDRGMGLDGMQEETAVTPFLDFVSSGEGVSLNQAFLRIDDDQLRRQLLAMVNGIARLAVGEN